MVVGFMLLLVILRPCRASLNIQTVEDETFSMVVSFGFFDFFIESIKSLLRREIELMNYKKSKK